MNKKSFDSLPPPGFKNTLFVASVGTCFLGCPCLEILEISSAQTLHSGVNFIVFWGALDLSKNSWKCVSVVNFRGLTFLKRRLFQCLDREYVFQLFFLHTI